MAFSVNIPRPVKSLAASLGVKILESKVIYSLMDEVRNDVAQLLPRIIETKVTGEATVLQIFEIQLKAKQTMKVAGCRVGYGTVHKNKKARVVRNGKTLFEGNVSESRPYHPILKALCFLGKIHTLRHLKRDMMEVAKGTECGIALEEFDDLREGDLIQIFDEIEKLASI